MDFEIIEGDFYYFEIIGFRVQDQQHGELGLIRDFASTSGQEILFMEYQGQEVLIPATRDFVLSADKTAQILRTALPEGLLELYLGDSDTDETS